MPKKAVKEALDLRYNFKVFWSFLQKYQGIFYVIILFAFLNEIIVFADNFLFKYLVDKGTLFSQSQLEGVLFAKIILVSIIIYLGIKVMGAFSWYITMQLINRLEARMMNDIENKSFWHVLNLSYRFHLNRKTGSIISQFTRGVSRVESFMDAFIFNFSSSFFRLVLSIAVITYFDLFTALALIGMAGGFIFCGIYFTHKQEEPQNKANEDEDNLKQNLSDIFFNVETVKYFAKENATYQYFQKLSHTLKNSRQKFWNTFSTLISLQNGVMGLGLAAIFYLSFTQFLNGKLTLGDITLIYAAVWKLLPQLDNFMHGYRQFIRSSIDINALFALYKEKNEVVDIPSPKNLQVKAGEISFQDVSFSYPERRKSSPGKKEALLQNFTLNIKKNSKIALVGPSGGGKTTVIKLLYRLFDLNNGKIEIDGQDLSKVTQHSLRSSLSIVPQEPILFDNSIYYNVAYANPKASREEVWKAIKFASLDKLIHRLPKGEKTVIGERGVKLSGGEKQRVSIARAILADKKILILDEATSSLDSATEREIQKYLEVLMQGRTTIMIAHRLSTIMKADLIVVLEKGKIVEKGTHQQLLQIENGTYRKLWEIQRGRKK